MRVLLVTNDFPPTIGGIQSYLRDFISTLPPQDVVVFASTQDAIAAANWDGQAAYRVYRWPRRIMLPTPATSREMQRLIREHGIGTVWFGAAAPLALMGAAAKRAGAAYVIAVVMRVAQGSATVALVTAAGLMAPAVEAAGYSAGQIAAITVATAAGSVFASHVNDSGFWLVGRFFEMDTKTTLRTWTVMETTLGLAAFGVALVLWWIGGAFGGELRADARHRGDQHRPRRACPGGRAAGPQRQLLGPRQCRGRRPELRSAGWWEPR